MIKIIAISVISTQNVKRCIVNTGKPFWLKIYTAFISHARLVRWNR